MKTTQCLLLGLSSLLVSCSVFQPYYNVNGERLARKNGYILQLNGVESKIAMRSGPGGNYKEVMSVEDGRFVGVAGKESSPDEQSIKWFPIKILENKGVISGYIESRYAKQLQMTPSEFSTLDR